jgi:hypothetical protein
MSSCSKAPRGLFVLLRTDGIFTVNALSPSSSSRQYPYHYAIRAGQNLPDKEFRYLRTVIVTAAVHWGFSSKRKLLPLTFQHRAGVSPYTSTFVLAQTYVFGKQLHGFLSCGPATLSTTIVSLLESAFFSRLNLNVYTGLYKKLKTYTNYCCFPEKKTGKPRGKHCGGADLIPKLRSLYCRVP